MGGAGGQYSHLRGSYQPAHTGNVQTLYRGNQTGNKRSGGGDKQKAAESLLAKKLRSIIDKVKEVESKIQKED